jgi:hypothetical protein
VVSTILAKEIKPLVMRNNKRMLGGSLTVAFMIKRIVIFKISLSRFNVGRRKSFRTPKKP